MKKYTEEELNGCSIHALRVILRSECGGVPGVLNKQGLIESILNIQLGGEKPSRSPKGRKPLDGGNLPFDIDLNLFDISVVSNKDVRVKGIVFIEKQGFATLLNLNCEKLENAVCISRPALIHFDLKNGDIVEGDAVYIYEKGGLYLKTISHINGKELSLVEKKDSKGLQNREYPNERFNLVYPKCAKTLLAVDCFSPIAKGQRCIVCDEKGKYSSDFIKNIIFAIKENHKDIDLRVLLVESKPEEESEIKEILSDGVLSVPFGGVAEIEIPKINLFIDSVKRSLESGNSVVLIIDGLKSLINLYDGYLKLITSEGELPFESGEQFVKNVFSFAGNYGKGKTLTVILTSAEEDEKLKQFISYATGVIRLKGMERNKRKSFIDLANSYAVKDDKFMTEEELEFADGIREGTFTEDEILQVLTKKFEL